MTTEPEGSMEGDATGDTAGLEERVDAVERALTGSDVTVAEIADGAAATAEREALAERLDSLAERVEELEAATQAVRGYTGAIRSVNREVERRADLALARATAARNATCPDATGPAHDGGDTGTHGGRPTGPMRENHTLPTEPAIEAAVPGDDPATELADGADPSSRTGGGRDGSGNDAVSPLKRLRDAL